MSSSPSSGIKAKRSDIFRLLSIGLLVALLLGGTVYAASGFRLISLGGMNFASFFDDGGANMGIEASSFHEKINDTWLANPADGANHIGGTTYFGEATGNTGVITAGGNMGIGTSAPSARLEVAGNIKISTGYLLLGKVNDINEGGEINFAGANTYSVWLQDVWQNKMRFVTQNQTSQVAMYDNGTGSVGLYVQGNVGIGRTDPTTKLDIYDNTTIPMFRIGTATHSFYAGAGTGSIVPWAGSSTNSDFILTSSGTERMRITAGGNIALVGSGQLTLPNAPIAGTDAVNKAYVDAQVAAAGAAGCTIIGGPCGGGVLGGVYNGYYLIATPPACTDSATPTCNIYGTDTVMKTWGAGGITTGQTSYYDGASNSAYLAANYSDTYAAKYCENMTYGGYSDWYLPAYSEFVILITNGMIGGTNAAYYATSTESAATTIFARYGNGTTGTSNMGKSVSNYVRCVRKQ